ncbi:MAG: MBL fold metallo-hydrolase [Actinomycetota bacterium]
MPSPGHSSVLPPVQDCGGGVLAIDSVMHGRPGVTAVYYLPGPKPAIIETAPATSLEAVLAGLEAAGVGELSWIVVTHVHLDHAGAVGHLAKRFPSASVVVRAEGAPHLVDPSRLWSSASRLYDDMEGLWGSMLPVPAERIVAVSEDGPVADLGDGRELRAVYTPGHAAHHMALYEPAGGDLFAGDAIGVYLTDVGAVRPALPPPEFDLEAALNSIERIRAARPTRVFPTHYGPMPVIDPLLDEASSRLNSVVALAESVVAAGGGVAAIREALVAEEAGILPDLSPALADRLAHTITHDLNARGVARYLRKQRGIAVGD